MEEEGERREEQVMSEVHLGCPPHHSGPYVSQFTVCRPPKRFGDRLQMGMFCGEMLSLGASDHCAEKSLKMCSSEHNDPESSDHLPQKDMPQEFLSLDEDGDLVLARRKSSNADSDPESSDHLPQKDTMQEFPSLDEDGDLVLARRKRSNDTSLNFGLTIQHTITSSLLEVGLQVWKAALVLTDFIFHRSFTSSDLNNIVAIELGAGTGLVGIALARVARTVFITDIGVHILDNCDNNIRLNSGLLKFQENSIRVRELDWKETWPPSGTIDLPAQHRSPKLRYLWSKSEIEEAESATVLLAADVVYSDELTDSFFSMLEKLMSRGSKKILYLALEKRYNFSLDELDVVANGYSHFRSFFRVDEDHGEDADGMPPCFLGNQIDLAEVPQYLREYDRGRDLEMWKITYCRKGDDDPPSSRIL